jgi:hypothetical protein
MIGILDHGIREREAVPETILSPSDNDRGAGPYWKVYNKPHQP